MDVIIWDEASMSSARMLELANALHHAVADKVTGNDKLFPAELNAPAPRMVSVCDRAKVTTLPRESDVLSI